MKLLAALTAVAVLTAPAFAAPCRDAKGHFMKCPTANPAMTPDKVTRDGKGRCHGTGGKFVACPK